MLVHVLRGFVSARIDQDGLAATRLNVLEFFVRVGPR